MKIVYLLESAGLWGGVVSILETANRLQDRGHQVTIVSRGPAPTWIDVRCDFRIVDAFSPEVIPEADVVVGTFWTTVPAAVTCGKGAPVHYCQGYEGDNPENAAYRTQIEEVYRMPQKHVVTISRHLANTLARRFDTRATSVTYAVNHDVMFPRDAMPAAGAPVRVGLIGPYDIAWKDIATGLDACVLAYHAGLNLQIVRVTNTQPHQDELDLDLPIEWHVQIPPSRMGDIYRSLDVFLGSSWGPEEGFFLPAVEAMACGVPCVLTDIPCHGGYGKNDYALFVPARDPQEMAEALVIAAKHPSARSALRRAGIETAQAYTYDNHVTELEHAFAQIAAAHERSLEPAARVL